MGLPMMMKKQLGSLWGPVPHRISHMTAMAMAPAAVKVGCVVDVSGPPVDPTVAARLKVHPYEEPADTLLVGANRLEGSTWISSPERALLECVKRDDEVPFGDMAAMEVLSTAHSVVAEEVIGLAERFGWDEPLRRLASVATRMDECRGVFPYFPDGFLAENHRAFLDVGETEPDSDWIVLSPYGKPFIGLEGEYLDHEYRVRWHEHPHVLFEDLLY